MRSRLPLKVKLIDLLRVFRFDQLGYELKLFSEFQDRLFENCDLPGSPVLEYICVSQWANQSVEVFLFVYRVHCVQVDFNRLLPLIVVELVDFRAGGQGWQDGMLLRLYFLHQGFKWVIKVFYADTADLSIYRFEFLILFSLIFILILFYSFPAVHISKLLYPMNLKK